MMFSISSKRLAKYSFISSFVLFFSFILFSIRFRGLARGDPISDSPSSIYEKFRLILLSNLGVSEKFCLAMLGLGILGMGIFN